MKIIIGIFLIFNFNLEKKKREILNLAKKEDVLKWSEFIIKYSTDSDILNFNYENFILHLKAIKENLEKVKWKDKINDYLLYHYILPPRITQEPLENFTYIYKDTLFELIKDLKNIRDAVLKINEWCYTKIEYRPTDRWDQNAISTIKRGFGRCEEMTILFMKALRTVCIPVREVYTP
ncbi:MAG: transglutaminase-like domain-containing protein, partial [candidate division WOR-3 bacterium]